MTSKARNGQTGKESRPDRQYIPEGEQTGDDATGGASSGSPRRYIQLDQSPSINPAEVLRDAQRPVVPQQRPTHSAAQEAMARHARDESYQIGEMVARGAEAVLYRTTGNSNGFCVKAIRNWLGKTIGDAATRGNEGKLDAAYRSKVRHLRNEFQVGKELQEPGDIPVVRIYALRKVRRIGIEVGYDLLMEYLDGIDLGSKQAARTFTTAQKVDFFYQSARALEYMHQRSFIHLDIKPSNIMVCANRVKLIDFGVTVSIGHRPRSVTGTAGYLSPEQIARDFLNQGTDIFALGVSFAVVFGCSPLRQDPAELKSRDSRTNAEYLLENDSAPIVRSVPELRDLPELAELISRCTIPCRSQRISDAADLAGQIRRAALAAGILVQG